MNWKIMAVDDHQAMRTLLRIAFECHGFEVTEVPDGRSAVEMVNTLHPHLILMDVRMPRMDGFTACQLIRSTAETADIPIIHLSSETCQAHQDESTRSGANLYLEKALSPFELVDRVQEMLRNHYH